MFECAQFIQRRRQQGDYHNLLQEVRLSDPESHFRYLRMSKEKFDSLLAKVGLGKLMTKQGSITIMVMIQL